MIGEVEKAKNIVLTESSEGLTLGIHPTQRLANPLHQNFEVDYHFLNMLPLLLMYYSHQMRNLGLTVTVPVRYLTRFLPNISLVLLNWNTNYSSSHSSKYANTIRIIKLSEIVDSGFQYIYN